MTTAPAAAVRRPWSTTVAIRFSHCDPAGIVYFASHFDILNGVMEDWFIEALGIDYHHVVGARRVGLGYAHAACDFAAPARMGDRVVYGVTVERVGTKSIAVRIAATKGT
jgi:4-hydroxybenzoyl-CoA thioesterase